MNHENKKQNFEMEPLSLSALQELMPLEKTGGFQPLLRDAIYYSYKIGRVESPALIYVPGVGNTSFN
mgnify:FL=1